METLMTYLTAFGLASGAGGKAAIPVLALGVFHYTPYFELSERFEWIASPLVMIILAVLMVTEILVDAHPDLGQYSDVAAYLPKITAGFIAFAAVTGEVDDSLIKLVASGVLGSLTATGATWLRNKFRCPIRDHGEDLHDSIGKMASIGESGLVATLSSAFILVPVVGLVILGTTGASGWLLSRKLDSRRTPCVFCGQPVRPGALICPYCQKEQSESAEIR